MKEEQLLAARENMVAWLSHPNELGRVPSEIECTDEFDYEELRYYVFKFKKWKLGKWFVGISGGFEKGSLVPCGHTFSDFQIYDEKTAREECIKMVRNIMEYWKAEAARIEQEQIL